MKDHVKVSAGAAMDTLWRKQDERIFYLTPENVLDYFTSVRTQTSLKEGVAEDNSLRFTRVVGLYDRSSGETLIFCAPVFKELYVNGVQVLLGDDREMAYDGLYKAVGVTNNDVLGRIYG